MKNWRTASAVIALILLAAVGYGAWRYFGTMSAESSAQRVVDACAEESGDHSTCYEREVPDLLAEMSLTKVFDVIRDIRTLDPSYQFCHVLAHKLGERIVAEDPDKWIDAIPLNPSDGMCSNGFIHGVLGGRFRAEVLSKDDLKKLIPDFSRACSVRPEWESSPLDRAICNHGMGHLYMFITDADIPLALSLCEQTMPEDMKRVCREGVFMQIYQPLEPDDFLLIERMPVKPTKETVRSFCARYTKDEYEGACLRESWPFFREEILSGAGIDDFCSGQPNRTEEVACYESSFSLAGRLSLADPAKLLSMCAETSDDWKQMCYSYGARTVLEEDRNAGEKSLGLCASAPEQYRDACIDSLVSTAQFIFGDAGEHQRFCKLVPQSQQYRCLGR